MTILYLSAGVLAAAFAAGVLAVKNKTALRVLLVLNIAAAAAGAVLFFVSLSLADAAPAQTDSADLLSWAEDAFTLWLRMGGITAAVIGGVLLLASLIRHKMVRIRALTGCAAVWLILLAASAYAAVCVGETLDPSPWIRLSGAGLALLMTAHSAADLAFRLREKPWVTPEKKQKTAKKSAPGRNARR